MANPKERLGIFLSGSGTTAEVVIKACKSGRINYDVGLVVSSRVGAPGIQKAIDAGVDRSDVIEIDSRFYKYSGGGMDQDGFGRGLLAPLQGRGIDTIAQLGWLPMTPDIVVKKYKGKIKNQHPGALQVDHTDAKGRNLDWGGKGMYGAVAVCAGIAYNWMSGEWIGIESTVHHVEAGVYDGGGVIRSVKFMHELFEKHATFEQLNEDPRALLEATKIIQAEFLPIEHENVIHTLEMASKGVNYSFMRGTDLVPERRADQLYQARDLAIRLHKNG